MSSGRYDDIIDLPHYVSPKRKWMSAADRAAQFGSFAALTGHGAAISETARLTSQKAELDECEKSLINEKLTILLNIQEIHPYVSIFRFVPDNKKEGGAYITAEGEIEKIDCEGGKVYFTDGTAVPVDDIRDIQSDCFGFLW